MNERPYPLFVPPEELGAKTSRERSIKEAKAYFAWFLNVFDRRVSDLLDYVGERLTGNAEEDLSAVGEKVAVIVRSPHFSYTAKAEPFVLKVGGDNRLVAPTRETEPKLTNAGYALAADMGLLVARLLLETCDPKPKWIISRRHKRDVSYQLPVLVGLVHDLHFEPIRLATVQMHGVLDGSEGPDAWEKIYKYWREHLC